MIFRAGDHVHHALCNEDWVLAVDQNRDDVMPAGWPETLAKASDCTLLKAASDAERLEMIRRVAGHHGSGLRESIARRQLAEHERSNPEGS